MITDSAFRRIALKPDDKFPTVAEIESVLGISHTTVMRAYNELERMGATKGKQKNGTRVRNDMSPGEHKAIIAAVVETAYGGE